MAGIGGCPNVGGICIGCTMPGFPDKFMPFMDEPAGAHTSSTTIALYGRLIRALRPLITIAIGLVVSLIEMPKYLRTTTK
jgi:hydrogenase small subunit